MQTLIEMLLTKFSGELSFVLNNSVLECYRYRTKLFTLEDNVLTLNLALDAEMFFDMAEIVNICNFDGKFIIEHKRLSNREIMRGVKQ